MVDRLTTEQIQMIYNCPKSTSAVKKMCIKYNNYEDFLRRLVAMYYTTYDPLTHKQVADIANDLLKD